MKIIGNLLALAGAALSVYALVGKYVGDDTIFGFTQLPFIQRGFSPMGVLSAAACILVLAFIALLKAKK
ncbi:MAG: hypothetical protein HQ594_05960 [Candidatus Omnitrophica bacterium]|nr:hypothetical protein [Candidatus Omnitrophota bacterium]